MKKLLLEKWFKNLFRGKLPYQVLYLEEGKVIKSKKFTKTKQIVGICLTDKIIYYPLPKDNSYLTNRDGFYASQYYGTWKEANDFFAEIKIPGYKVVSAPIDDLVIIMDAFRKLNPILQKFGCEPIHEDWYYWSGTSSDCEHYAWDYCNDRTGRGMNEYGKSAYLKTERNHFLGVLISE